MYHTTLYSSRENQRSAQEVALVHTLSPEGELLPHRHGERGDDEDGHEEGLPLQQGAGTGLDWFSVATEASGGGTPDLLCSSIVLGYMDIYI